MIKQPKIEPEALLKEAIEIFHNEMVDVLVCPECHNDALIPLGILSVDSSGVFAKYDCKRCEKIITEGLGDLFTEFEQLGEKLKGLLGDLYCAELKSNGDTIDIIVIAKDNLQDAVDVFSRLEQIPENEQYIITLTGMKQIFERK